MRIFVTGTSGYIGGSIAVALVAAGHEVSGLVRSEQSAEQVKAFGLTPVHGTLDDVDVLRAAAVRADAVINSANADHEPSAQALLGAIEGTGKTYIHTSGSSIVGTQSAGGRVDAVFDEFLHHGRRSLDHLSSSNLVGDFIRQKHNSAHTWESTTK